MSNSRKLNILFRFMVNSPDPFFRFYDKKIDEEAKLRKFIQTIDLNINKLFLDKISDDDAFLSN